MSNRPSLLSHFSIYVQPKGRHRILHHASGQKTTSNSRGCLGLRECQRMVKVTKHLCQGLMLDLVKYLLLLLLRREQMEQHHELIVVDHRQWYRLNQAKKQTKLPVRYRNRILLRFQRHLERYFCRNKLNNRSPK